MNRIVLLVGILITAALVGVFYMALGNDPQHIDSPLVGRVAPPFSLQAVGTHELIDVSQFRGKPVVLNFWATWCHPCWDEHPVLTQTAQTMNGQVQFVGVVFQDKESNIEDFLRQRGWAYPTLVDVAGKTAIAYGVGGVPETFFLDANGKIVDKYAGPLSSDLLEEKIRKAMR
jgi:cytochrome c biogenesis protein CcmG/thiol:disulfide interchange protein DsbE